MQSSEVMNYGLIWPGALVHPSKVVHCDILDIIEHSCHIQCTHELKREDNRNNFNLHGPVSMETLMTFDLTNLMKFMFIVCCHVVF